VKGVGVGARDRIDAVEDGDLFVASRVAAKHGARDVRQDVDFVVLRPSDGHVEGVLEHGDGQAEGSANIFDAGRHRIALLLERNG
jgi:hypothetical protein